MIQLIERRRVDRRVAERRRSHYNNENAVGIYRCDCCDYYAASRGDDINHHFTYLVHSIVRIFHQIVDYVMEYMAAPKVLSSVLPSTVTRGTSNFVGNEKSRAQHSNATGRRAHFSFLSNIDWKECILENLHMASQALALVATLAGGIVFAATALMFAIFPSGSGTGDFHEAMEREYRRKLEAERKRREREEDDLKREEEEQQRTDDDEVLKVQEEMERINLRVKRDGFKYQDPNDKISLRENDRRTMKLNYAADDVLNGKTDIDSFDKDLTEFRKYEEERTKRSEKEKREKDKHYRRYLNAQAEAHGARNKADDARRDGDEREYQHLMAKYEELMRKSKDHHTQSL